MAPRQQEEGEKAKQLPQLPAKEASKVSEYRILALYRFVPLVTPAKDDDDDGNYWDEQSLMKHPERHPQLKHLQSELYTTSNPISGFKKIPYRNLDNIIT